MANTHAAIQNLKENIFDLTMAKEIQSREEPQELKYGIDYDYIIESFYAEYKLNVKELQTLREEYTIAQTEPEKQILRDKFHKLWPEHKLDDITAGDKIPETVIKKLYFVQSPKGVDGLPAIHYSLKEKMLSDLRAIRSKVKKQMEKAAEEGDHISEVRYNAKQLAIKVVCNSEYGASNNEHFAHYDPDVPACTTCTSRRLIQLLTAVLEAQELFVDQKFLKDNSKQIEVLANIECIKIVKDESFKTKDLDNKGQPLYLKFLRHSIRRLYDDAYRIINPDNVYKIGIKPSTVCYQDTDSNYYRNIYITDYYTRRNNEYQCDPDIINDCMHAMLAHNELIANFIRLAIQRRPYGLGFEGAFIVCRYLNRKKKYYGIKWGDDAELRLGTRLPDDAYESDGTLKQNYLPWWKPKKTVLPQPNGEYIYLDNDKLLHTDVNYLDYIRGQNVKCTGVDLARRDQYKFINYFHMKVLQQDLRIMKYLGNNAWEMITTKESIKDIVDYIIELFRQSMVRYNAIGMLDSDIKPEIDFNILDFARTSAYRPGKLNTTATIIARLKEQKKDKYIPRIGERISYVVTMNEKVENERSQGKIANIDLAERSILINELLEVLRSNVKKDDTLKAIAAKNLKLTYDEVINAKLICMLDMKYYLECLCKSMALYVVGDIYPNEVQRIDNGEINSNEANILISKLQSNIAKEYLQKYFPTNASVKAQAKETNKSLNITYTNDEATDIVYEMYPRLKESSPTLADLQTIDGELGSTIESKRDIFKRLDKVYKHIITDRFIGNIFSKDPILYKVYEQHKDKPRALAAELEKYKTMLSRYVAAHNIIKKWLRSQK